LDRDEAEVNTAGVSGEEEVLDVSGLIYRLVTASALIAA